MILENNHLQFIADIKEKVRKAQYEALKKVNVELINLYWDLGKAISENRKSVGVKLLYRLWRKNFKRSSLK